MSDLKSRQTTDAAQGGEGTTSLDGKSYDAMTVSISEVENTAEPLPPKETGTK